MLGGKEDVELERSEYESMIEPYISESDYFDIYAGHLDLNASARGRRLRALLESLEMDLEMSGVSLDHIF